MWGHIWSKEHDGGTDSYRASVAYGVVSLCWEKGGKNKKREAMRMRDGRLRSTFRALAGSIDPLGVSVQLYANFGKKETLANRIRELNSILNFWSASLLSTYDSIS